MYSPGGGGEILKLSYVIYYPTKIYYAYIQGGQQKHTIIIVIAIFTIDLPSTHQNMNASA
jgi:hypothetical protein